METWAPRLLGLSLVIALCSPLGGCSDEMPVPLMPPTPPPPGPAASLCAAKTLGPWSRKTVGAGGVVSFHEIMYHPAGDPRLEWIELYNPLAIPVDLSGFRLDGAVRYSFPPDTFIAGRGLLVVAADADLLARALGRRV